MRAVSYFSVGAYTVITVLSRDMLVDNSSSIKACAQLGAKTELDTSGGRVEKNRVSACAPESVAPSHQMLCISMLIQHFFFFLS